MSRVVKKSMVTPTSLIMARLRKLVPADEFHPIEHRPIIPSKTAAAGHGLLDSELSYVPQKRRGKAGISTKLATRPVILGKVQPRIAHKDVCAPFIVGGIQDLFVDEHHCL